mmetsp:Transcript_40000/g.87298  ORF Transcript_40000/g.87298 Transcript_40000/m.87298 type:complete len:81 (-) Transcript_40000:13-255(-)
MGFHGATASWRCRDSLRSDPKQGKPKYCFSVCNWYVDQATCVSRELAHGMRVPHEWAFWGGSPRLTPAWTHLWLVSLCYN